MRKSVVVPPAKFSAIQLSDTDRSSPKSLGRKVLKDLTSISQQVFQKSTQEVLAETPRSQLILKQTKGERKKLRQKIDKQVRDQIQRDKTESESELVLQNRISWNVYDRIRKSEEIRIGEEVVPSSTTRYS